MRLERLVDQHFARLSANDRELLTCIFREKKDFYTRKIPKNAVKSAVFGNYGCLGGV